MYKQFLRAIALSIAMINIPYLQAQDNCSVGTPNGSLTVSDMGAAVYSLNFEVPNGGPLTPQIGIAYNSQKSGYGLAGYGFDITGISCITRGGKDVFHNKELKGVTYTESDNYYLDGKRLVLVSGEQGKNGSKYCLEGDPYTEVFLYQKAEPVYEHKEREFTPEEEERLRNGEKVPAPYEQVFLYDITRSNFVVKTQTGQTLIYGADSNSKLVFDSGLKNETEGAWYLARTEDQRGNYVSYSYIKSDYIFSPSQITYGNENIKSLKHTIKFNYQSLGANARPIVVKDKKGEMNRCLASVETKTNNNLYRKYTLAYNETTDRTNAKWHRLDSVTVSNGKGEKMHPIKFNWEFLSNSIIQTSQLSGDINRPVPNDFKDKGTTLIEEKERMFFSSDLNGDGISDIIKLSIVSEYHYDSIFNYPYIAVSLSHVANDGTVTYLSEKFYKIGNWTLGSLGDIGGELGQIQAFDINADGYNDFIIPLNIHGSDYFNKENIYVLLGDAKTPKFTSFEYSLLTSHDNPLYSVFDVDGNGTDDFISLECSKINGGYPVRYISHDKGERLYQSPAITFSLPQTPKRLYSGDYNNDGLTDLFVLMEDKYKIFYHNGGTNFETVYSNSNSYTGTSFCDYWRVAQGDFNGDGQMDFVYSADSDKEHCLRIAYNNGNSTFTRVKAYNLGFGNKEGSVDNDKFSINVLDINHDGLSDVFISKAQYEYRGGFHNHFSFTGTENVWLQSNGETFDLIDQFSKNRESDSKEGHIFAGDFDGDGYIELANYGSNLFSKNDAFKEDKINIYKSGTDLSSLGKITRIQDGMGNVSDISYSNLTKPEIYTRSFKNEYPVNAYTIPISVVKEIKSDNGTSNRQTIKYRYEDFKVCFGGRGMLGFGSVTQENVTMGTKTVTSITKWDTEHWVPAEVRQESFVGNKKALQVSTYKVSVPKYTAKGNGGKTYYAYVAKSENTDLEGNNVSTVTDFDLYRGMFGLDTTYYGSPDFYKVQCVAKYDTIGGVFYPERTTTIYKHKDDESEYRDYVKYFYDKKGNVITKIQNYAKSLPLTTTMTYDTVGNMTSTLTTGVEVIPIKTYYVYDNTKRFVIRKYTENVVIAATDKEPATVTAYTYDNWGNVLTEIDSTNAEYPLVTKHTYDGWGRKTSTTDAMGLMTRYEIGWGNSAGRKYFTKVSAEGQAPVTTWYDKGGREVLQETFGPMGISISKETKYNAKGQVAEVVSKKGSLSITKSFDYDERGRVTAETTTPGHCVSYAYGNRTTTTTVGSRTSTTTYDAWGNVVKVVDPISNVTSYKYCSNGKPQSVTSGKSTVTMTYDDMANQSSLTDPDAGTMTYSYGAGGNVVSQTDGRGIKTSYVPDELARTRITNINNEKKILYYYIKKGKGKHQLSSQHLDDNYIYYEYDEYGHVTQEKYSYGKHGTHVFYYKYNDLGQLVEKKYPGGLTETYEYDQYGFKTRSFANGMEIYKSISYDGQESKSSFMESLTRTNSRDSIGFLTHKSIMGNDLLEDFKCCYDASTGNLMSRTRMGYQDESFSYDALDRLISVNKGNVNALTMTYADNGNILNKSDVGGFSYTSNLPHAVNRIKKPLTDKDLGHELTTDFNLYGKIERIYDNRQNLTMNFEYGPNMSRLYSAMSNGEGDTVRSTIYAGDYEKVTENGVTREFYYLDGGTIVVKQDGIFTPYLTFTDNLGSILSVMDANGRKVFEASYDAWGKQTITLNEIGLQRGYTGHEMLNEFDIINMNGRLYDPVLGRFFSPDNYVQAPGNSQNFNRYSYCLNNPLKYNDPSGNVFVIDDTVIAFTVFSVASSMMTASYSGKNVWKAGGIAMLSSLATYGIGSACSALVKAGVSSTGAAFIQMGAHGINSGLISALNGGSFGQGFVTGALSSGMGKLGTMYDWSFATKLAAMTAMGGAVSWATGGSFFEGALRGMEIAAFNDGMHDKTINLPEVECIYNKGNRIVWPTITKILYEAIIVNGSRFSKGYYSMYHNDQLIFQCQAVSGSPKAYTIPDEYKSLGSGFNGIMHDEYHVNNIWYRNPNIKGDEGYFRQGIGYTASLKEDPFIDGRTGNKRDYIRIHPCRYLYTEGCIGLLSDDKNVLQLNYDLIKCTLDSKSGLTIPLKVNITNCVYD